MTNLATTGRPTTGHATTGHATTGDLTTGHNRTGRAAIGRAARAGAVGGRTLAALAAAALAAACGTPGRDPAPGRASTPAPDTAYQPSPGADPVDSAAEHRAVRAAGGRVRRRGLTLTIRAEAGPPVAFVDDTASEGHDYVRHRYLGRLAGAPFHLLALGYFEGRGYLLVHARTGRRLLVDARPVVSPDGARLATASMDLVAGFDPTRLAVMRIVGDTVAVEWALEPGRWGPSDARWRGPDTLAFTAHHLDGDALDPVRTSPGLLVRARGRWTLRRP